MSPVETDAPIRLAVLGAHLQGQPLHHQLTDLDATFVGLTTTAPAYRLHALDTIPPKPGIARVAEGGVAIEVEVYELGPAAFGRFVDAIPAPLGIGRLELADTSVVAGFICEPIGLDRAPDISGFGGWRAYLTSGGASPP
ncbi:MAG: hypothetical protein U0Q22_12795 [Acidimicrobiales bacterium]